MSQSTTANVFKRATKRAAKLRLALMGPPGSGKTYSALASAAFLVEMLEAKKIAVIDTEKGSASKYADLFDFDVLELEGSFHPRRYVEAIKAAESSGYGVIVIDSLSHAWIGEEGGLDLHDKAVAKQKTKNSFTAWGEVTPHHNALVQALIQSKAHVIGTLRSKIEYVQESINGKSAIRKVGMAPLMREGLEYEFDVVGDIDADHNLVITKSRCSAVADKMFNRPGRDFIGHIIKWLGGGEPPAQEERKQQSAIGHQANIPADGAELEARIRLAEDKAVAAGRCKPDELFTYMREMGAKLGQPPGFTRWSADALRESLGWFTTFLSLHPAQANGTPAASPPPAPAPEHPTSTEKVRELQALMAQKGRSWARKERSDAGDSICRIFDLPETTMIEDLSPLKYAEIKKALSEERDFVRH